MYKILYVDDEPGLLEIGKLFLEQGGKFSVDTITSAQSALTLMGSTSYDAIISDYQMPVMDGIAFLKKVRGTGNRIPFILFTGRGREEIVIQALNEGADFYLQKGGMPDAQFAELSHKTRQAVEHRRAESEIRDHEQREADILNFLPDATFAIDRSGLVIAWNHAIETMTGVVAAEILGKGNYEYAIPFYGERRPILIDLIFESDEIIARKYAHIIHEKDILIADTTLPRPKGIPVTLTGKASPLYNRQGEIVGAIESIRDITDIKKTLESLRESEGQFAAFMDHLPVTAFIADEQFANLFVNRRMEEIFGPREWIGNTVRDLFPREAAETMIDDDRRALRDGYRKTLETLIGKNGEKKIFETYKFRIDRENKPPLLGGFSVDVTEQKEAEKSLSESEARFRELADLLPQMVYEADADGMVTYANRIAFERFGYSEDDLKKGLNVLQVFVPRDRERVAAVFKAVAEGTGVAAPVTEYLALQKDGGTFPVSAYSSPIVRNNKVVGLRGIVIDITERKRAEEELQAGYEQISASEAELRAQYDMLAENEKRIHESEEKFKTLFEKSSEAQILLNASGRLADCNAAFLALLAIPSREDVLGNSPAEFAPEFQPDQVSSRERGSEIYHDVMKKGAVLYEWAHQKHDAAKTPIMTEVICTLIQVNGQSMIHASIRDITARKKAQNDLRDREATLSSIFRAAPVGIGLVLDRVLIRVNDRVGEMTGYSAEELIGKSARILYPDDKEFERVGREKYERIRTSGTGTIVTRWQRKDGTVRDILLSSTPVNPADPREGVTFTALDITDHKRAEAMLRESEEKYRDIFENSVIGLFKTAPDGTIIHANDSLARMYGYTGAADFINGGVKAGQLYANPEDRNAVLSNLEEKGIVKNYETLHLKRDGTRFRVLISARTIRDPQGNVLFYEGTIIDISEFRRGKKD